MNRPRIAALFLLIAPAAHPDGLSREFAITPAELKEAPAFITCVAVPDATCAAVSDAHSLLVVGHETKDDKHLAVFKLDADGRPSAAPVWVPLPKPERLREHFNYPVGLLFHPKLPLLYVWQDIDGPPAKQQEKHPDFAPWMEFDHLLIFEVKNGALELLHAGARGAGFHVGLKAGTVGLDAAMKNLFVPNTSGDTPEEAGIGWFALDAEGLPAEDLEKAPEKGREKGVEVSVGSNAVRKVMRRVVPKKNRSYRYFPTGIGWVAGSEAIIMGGYSGCMMGDFHDGILRQSWFDLSDLTGPTAIAGHPSRPVIYMALQDNRYFYTMAQVNGWLTMLPQVALVGANAHFVGTPVAIEKHGKVAIGDAKALHLFGLQPDGRLDGKGERLKLGCAQVRGLACSDKHARLYVAVDKND